MKQKSKITQWFLNFYSGSEDVLAGLVESIATTITRAISSLAVIMAPITPAIAVYTAMVEALHVHMYVALIGALSIEVIGMFSTSVSIRAWHWEKSRNKTDVEVPLKLSIAATVTFFVISLIVTTAIEVWPTAAILIYPGFIIMAGSVYLNRAVNLQLADLENAKAELQHQRDEKNGINAEIRAAKDNLSSITQQHNNLLKKIEMATEKAKTITATQNKQAQDTIKFLKSENDKLITTVNDLKRSLLEVSQASVILEASQIVDHRITELNGHTAEDFISDDKVLLEGIAKEIAIVRLDSGNESLSLEGMANKIGITVSELTSVLKEYKGMGFVKFDEEYYAIATNNQEVIE